MTDDTDLSPEQRCQRRDTIEELEYDIEMQEAICLAISLLELLLDLGVDPELGTLSERRQRE